MSYRKETVNAVGGTGCSITTSSTSSKHTVTVNTDADQGHVTNVGTLTSLAGGTGDLVWDTDTLVVDSSENKVGIGCTTPDRKLDVQGGDDFPQARLSYDDATNYTDLHTTNNGTFRIRSSARTVQVDTGDANGGNLQFTKSGGVVSGSVSWDTGDKDVTLNGQRELNLDGVSGVNVKGNGTTAITVDASGHVTKIGQDSISAGDVLTWDGSKWVGESPTTGDITGVTAGAGLSGGGSDGGVTLALDISEFSDAGVASGDKVLILDSDGSTELLESVDDLITKTPALLTEATVAVADDYVVFLDGGATGDAKKESIADFVSGIAGSGLSASNGQLTASGSGTITALNNQAESRLVTIGNTTTELDGEAGLTFDGSTFAVSADVTVTSSTSDKPELTLKNTNADANPATMHFTKDSASPADGDELGEIVFNADDDGGTATMCAKIVGVSADVTNTTEDGQILFKIRSNGGVKQICSVDATALTIGEGEEEDTMIVFDGHQQDFRIGLDDGDDVLEIGHGSAHGTNTAISVNSSGQVAKLNVAAGTVAQAADHILFFDGGATGAPKAESIDDFLTAIAGSGISVSSSQLTAGGGGAFGTTVQTKTAGYTVADGDGVILCDSLTGTTAFTITLPTSGLSAGTQFTIKDSGGGASSYNITVDPQAKNIDGSTTDLVISADFGSVTLLVDSSHNYWIM